MLDDERRLVAFLDNVESVTAYKVEFYILGKTHIFYPEDIKFVKQERYTLKNLQKIIKEFSILIKIMREKCDESLLRRMRVKFALSLMRK
jgi:hypothetical protein